MNSLPKTERYKMSNSIQEIFQSLNWADRKKYFLYLFLKVVISVLDLIGILYLGLLTAVALGNFTGTGTTIFLGQFIPPILANNLPMIAIIGLIFFVTKACGAILVGHHQAMFFSKVDTDTSVKIVRFSMKNGLTALKTYTPDSWQWAVMESTSNAYSGVLMNLSVVISEGILLLLIFTLFGIVNLPGTAIILFYLGLIFGVMQLTIGRLQGKHGRRYAEGVIGSTNSLRSIFSAFKEIDVLDKSDFFANQFRQSRFSVATSLSQSRFLMTLPRYVIETGLIIGIVLFILWQYSFGILQPNFGSVIGIFIAGSLRLMGSAIPLQNSISALKTQIPQSRASMELVAKSNEFNLQTSLDKPAPRIGKSETLMSENNPIKVKLRNVGFSFPGASIPAISDISFELERGSFTAIIGPSGAGKSTIADLILGLLTPVNGEILIDDLSTSEFINRFPGKLAYVPQRPGMVSGNIVENIAFGLDQQSIDQARLFQVIEQAQLTTFINELPEGIYSNLGNHLDSLSGGQLQRIGLARALYTNPRLLIMDEATSALDAGTEALVTKTIIELLPEVTILVIAHRLSTVKNADKVLLVQDGMITSSGTFEELRKNFPIVAEYSKLLSLGKEFEQ